MILCKNMMLKLQIHLNGTSKNLHFRLLKIVVQFYNALKQNSVFEVTFMYCRNPVMKFREMGKEAT
jgi:hypothetical protein